MDRNEALFRYCLRMADNALVLAQRMCEWCGHGPILEEDIAMSNMGLDLLGQARGFYAYAAQVEGKGRSEDDLAFLRDERGFCNRCLVEQPNGDFGQTMMRNFLYSCAAYLQFRSLVKSTDEVIAGLSEKALKEVTYHVRHTSGWIIRLGDGTSESHSRIEESLPVLWQFTDELFEMDEVDEIMIQEGVGIDLSSLRPEWDRMVDEVFSQATLVRPSVKGYQSSGGIRGMHSEYLGHMLAEMQFLPRAFPGAEW